MIESLEEYLVFNESAKVIMAVKDGYKRLLLSSIETEYLQSGKQKADEEAIKVFAENLRQLRLAPPLNRRVLGMIRDSHGMWRCLSERDGKSGA